jgi:outer membrane immunogenic protein
MAVAPPPPLAPATLGSGDIVDKASPVPPVQPATTAFAGLTPTIPVNWTGLYVGGNLGFGNTTGGTGESCFNSVTGNTTGCDIINDGSLHTSGVLGGAQIGYLKPFDVGWSMPLMLGAEIDVQGTGINGSQSVNGPFQLVGLTETCAPCSFTASQKIDWFTTLRARIGVPVDNFLIYGTGGVIVGGVKVSQDLNFTGTSAGNLVSSKSTLSGGPVVGGGVEVALSGPWSARLEGLYYDLGSTSTVAPAVNGAPGNFTDRKTFGFHGAMIRLGVNLRLGDVGAE